MLSQQQLNELYVEKKLSMHQIAAKLHCSVNQVAYWMNRYQFKRRTVAEGVYVKWNPGGDPFRISQPRNIKDAFLFGLGVGLYWGEGTKANKHSIRLGNTDPDLIRQFIKFLREIYGIEDKKLRFGLQLFSDMSPEKALRFWCRSLDISRKQFSKVVVTPSRGAGTYVKKIKHGVLTVYYHNRKLRDILCDEIEKMR